MKSCGVIMMNPNVYTPLASALISHDLDTGTAKQAAGDVKQKRCGSDEASSGFCKAVATTAELRVRRVLVGGQVRRWPRLRAAALCAGARMLPRVLPEPERVTKGLGGGGRAQKCGLAPLCV